MKARHVPHALKPLIEREITRLVDLGHLEPVESSEWATPIVPVLKGKNEIRICGDFKLTINPHIIMNKYPLHHIDDIFAALKGEKKCSQLDLSHANMQVSVEKSCRHYLTIITPLGLFRYTKIGEGVNFGPEEFQKIMDDCLRDIEGAIAYLDNIFVTGRTEKEHIEVLEKLCKRMQECGFRLNKSKC